MELRWLIFVSEMKEKDNFLEKCIKKWLQIKKKKNRANTLHVNDLKGSNDESRSAETSKYD